MNIFTRHPHEVGETYRAHLYTAAGFGMRMIVAGSACVVHSVLPMLFPKTASNTVRALYAQMQGRGQAQMPPPHFLPEYEI